MHTTPCLLHCWGLEVQRKHPTGPVWRTPCQNKAGCSGNLDLSPTARRVPHNPGASVPRWGSPHPDMEGARSQTVGLQNGLLKTGAPFPPLRGAGEGFEQKQNFRGEEEAPGPLLAASPAPPHSLPTRLSLQQSPGRYLSSYHPAPDPSRVQSAPPAGSPHLSFPRVSSSPLPALGATSPGGKSPALTGPDLTPGSWPEEFLALPSAADMGCPACTGVGSPASFRPQPPRPPVPPPQSPSITLHLPWQREPPPGTTSLTRHQHGPTRT